MDNKKEKEKDEEENNDEEDEKEEEEEDSPSLLTALGSSGSSLCTYTRQGSHSAGTKPQSPPPGPSPLDQDESRYQVSPAPRRDVK